MAVPPSQDNDSGDGEVAMAALDTTAGEKFGGGDGLDSRTLHMAAITKHSRLLRKELLSMVKVHHFNA